MYITDELTRSERSAKRAVEEPGGAGVRLRSKKLVIILSRERSQFNV